MHLVVAATQLEMDAFRSIDSGLHRNVESFVCGVGPVESGIRVSQFLAAHHRQIDSVVNFGIGGAYNRRTLKSPELLDICVADREVLGDFGVCYGNETVAFEGEKFPVRNRFEIDTHLVDGIRNMLRLHDIDFHTGTFVTVNGSSGSKARGDYLSGTFEAICENMEGAAIACACDAYDVPFAEVRVISNLVEDRPGTPWKIDEACTRAARIATLIVQNLQDNG